MKRFNWLVPCSFTAVSLLLMPAACSVDLSSLKAGCVAPLVNCKGKCSTSCASSGGGASGGAGGADITGTSGADTMDIAGEAGQMGGGSAGDTGGTGNTGGALETGGSGAVGGNPLNCTTVSYPFHYTPQPPTFPIPTMDVHVSGDWLNWDTGAVLAMGEDGTYRASVEVPLNVPTGANGKHLYKFRIDEGTGGDGAGTWLQDPDNPNSEADPFLGRNSVIQVKCGVDYTAGSGGASTTGGAAGQGGN